MPYTQVATSRTPQLIIYLLDVSGSMAGPIGQVSRIEVVMNALRKITTRMIQRSTKGTMVSPRYRIAMFAYSSGVFDLLKGVKNIAELANIGIPQLTPIDKTDTAAAFEAAEKVLADELPGMQDCPAPLVCHMTDGEYTGDDPEPIARRIMQLAVPDGNVLIENIYVGDLMLKQPITDLQQWEGIRSSEQLQTHYAKKLFNLSSVMPQGYLNVMREMGYHFEPEARMMLPGSSPELIELGFTISGATPLTR